MQIEVRHGSFSYPGFKPVLNDVNFSFDGVGVMSILGPNGAGKTTLLRAMLGLISFTRGESLVNGKRVQEWKPKDFWRTVGYVPQAKTPGFAAMSIADMVVLGRSTHVGAFGLPGPKDWAIVDRVLEEVGLSHLSNRLCSEVSGGQLQLAMIARALAAEPRLLVLDEPESNLDFKNQLVVLNVIKRLTSQGLGVILNTHFPVHALELSQKTLLVPLSGSPIYGETTKTITETNLSALFDIDIKISSVKINNSQKKLIFPLTNP